jgi:hypothetical protein
MHVPIAHGEGRFTTKDKALWKALMDNDQLAFSYCDANGREAPTNEFNPNGSEYAAAGICNPEGNVVALMPHPERTPGGAPYFASLKQWIEKHPTRSSADVASSKITTKKLASRKPTGLEIFIDTVIVNNEERTVEQSVKRILPSFSAIAFFNPNKEVAFVRRGEKFFRWDADTKRELPDEPIAKGALKILRRDDPDTGGAALGQGSETGICYVCSGVDEKELFRSDVLELFGNPHASFLELL